MTGQPQPVPVLQGTLWKQGARGITRAWKKRHFVLSFDNKMRYFAGSVEKGSIDLSQVQRVTIINSASLEFDIESPGRTYHLRTTSPNLLNYWVNGILESMSALHGQSRLANHEVEPIEASPRRGDRVSSVAGLITRSSSDCIAPVVAPVIGRERLESAPVRYRASLGSVAPSPPNNTPASPAAAPAAAAVPQTGEETSDVFADASPADSGSDGLEPCPLKGKLAESRDADVLEAAGVPGTSASVQLSGPPSSDAPAPPSAVEEECDLAVLRARVGELTEMYKAKCVQLATLNGHYTEQLKALRKENDAKESELLISRSFEKQPLTPVPSRPASLDPRATPRGIVAKVKALYAFQARTENELSFDAQDEISVYDKSDSGWWKGELNGKVGLFPQRFTVVIEHEQSLVKQASQLLLSQRLSTISDEEDSPDAMSLPRASSDSAAMVQEERELMRTLVGEVDRLQGEVTTLSDTLLQVVGQVDGLSDDIVDLQTRNEKLVSDLDVAQAELAASHELVQKLRRRKSTTETAETEDDALTPGEPSEAEPKLEVVDIVEANALLQQYKKRLREQAAEVEHLQSEEAEKTRQVMRMVERLGTMEAQYAAFLKGDTEELEALPPRDGKEERCWVAGKTNGGEDAPPTVTIDPPGRAAAPVWLPDVSAPVCYGCRSSFTVLRRRHHCRNCGKIFCASCSASKCTIAEFGYKKPVRVCDECCASIGSGAALPPDDQS